MSRISSDLAAMRAQQDLVQANRAMQQAMERLATGLRINRAADDPGGLVTSEGFASEAQALTPAIEQTQRAGNLVATADGALAQVAELLLSIQQAVLHVANSGTLSAEEAAASQLEVDAAIGSVRQLVESTSYAGRKLLDGTFAYRTSGLASAAIGDLDITRAVLQQRGYLPVRLEVTTSAQHAELRLATSQLAGPAHIHVAGRGGSETFMLASGTAASGVMLAINQVSENTGVSASLLNAGNPASGIRISSIGFGSAAFVSVEPISGGFQTTDVSGAAARIDQGRDAAGTLNGKDLRADGQQLSLFAPELELRLRLADNFATGSTTFLVTGGGALFQIGPTADARDQAHLGIGSLDPAHLGSGLAGYLGDLATGGDKALIDGHAPEAYQVISGVIQQVASLRGRLGAFARDTIEQRVNSMTGQLENVRSSESAIRDADFAAEVNQLSRAQLLSQVAISMLAVSRTTRESVLTLLS